MKRIVQKSLSGVFGVVMGLMSTVGWTVMAQDDGIAVNAQNFPDPIFSSYVQSYLDPNHDGILSMEEMYQVQEISVRYKGISSLEGIGFFPELNVLYCQDNNLTQLDLSKNLKLTTLYCSDNQLSSLDITAQKNLQLLDCFNNPLTDLDLTQNLDLEQLTFGGDRLKSIDITHNHNLENLIYLAGQIQEFDLRQNPHLIEVWISGTPLESLDLSGNKELQRLLVYNTNLKTMHIDDMPYLEGNQINVSNNHLISLHTNVNQKEDIILNDQRPLTVKIPRSQTEFDLRTLDPDIRSADIKEDGSVPIIDGKLQEVHPGMTVSYYYTENGIQLHCFITFEEENSWIVPLSIQNWTYGDEPSCPYAQSAFGSVEYSYSQNADGPFVAKAPTEAGRWIVKAAVQPGPDYQGLEAYEYFTIEKRVPEYPEPRIYTGWKGKPLSSIALDAGFSWQDASEVMESSGVYTFLGTFTPQDTRNYETVKNIPIQVEVKEKESKTTKTSSSKQKVYTGSAFEKAGLFVIMAGMSLTGLRICIKKQE